MPSGAAGTGKKGPIRLGGGRAAEQHSAAEVAELAGRTNMAAARDITKMAAPSRRHHQRTTSATTVAVKGISLNPAQVTANTR